eukprot:scaffold105351_cov55-Attheya_sp.AAC.5
MTEQPLEQHGRTTSDLPKKEPIISSPLLEKFPLYGWKPDPNLTDDENYMDLVLLVTRSSTCTKHGHVACVLVDPALAPPRPLISIRDESVAELEKRLYATIVGAATNRSLFRDTDSDIHAEIACLAQACQTKRRTVRCTAYITIRPCKNCFAALVAFQVDRIVSRQLAPPEMCAVALQHDMQMAELTRDQNRAQMKRINELVNGNTGTTDEELMKFTERRKQWRANKKRNGGANEGQQDGGIGLDNACKSNDTRAESDCKQEAS